MYGKLTLNSTRDYPKSLANMCPQWIPTYLTPKYHLETSDKGKRAMFVQEFWVLEYAHWVEDPKRLPGLVRVQVWVMHLISAATSCRPAAVSESSSAKGTNKALWFKHVEILKIRHPDNSGRIVHAAKVDLVNIKDSGGQGKPCAPPSPLTLLN